MTLQLKNISFEINEKLLFAPIDCELKKGELLQIFGMNGSGKSTLLRIMAGFIEPSLGDIFFNEKSIQQQREEYQSHIHYLGHQNGIKPYLTVTENIRLHAAVSNTVISSEDIILKKLNLISDKNKLANQLSSGQMRRLALTRFFLQKKRLWILDEPLTSLDQDAILFFNEMLQQHLRNDGMAIVATHQPLPFNGKKIQMEHAHDKMEIY
jgi:heme exporter protein A